MTLILTDRDPEELESLAWDNPGAVLELDPETRCLHLKIGRREYVSTPLHVMEAIQP